MKVVIACDVLGEKNNGTSMASYNLINYLKSKGHEVTVICSDSDKKGQEGFVIVDKLNLGPLLNPILAKNGVSLTKKVKNNKEFEKVIKNSDIVHCILPFSLGISACKTAKKYGKPVTAGFHCQAENVTSHFGVMNSSIINKTVYKVFHNKFYQYVDGIHYPTEFIRENYENVVGKTNGYVISNGVNSYVRPMPCEKPENLKDKFVILTTGRLSKEKMQGVLIKAISKSKHNKDIQLIMAGAGPFKERLIRKSKKLVNPPIIQYFTREEMIKLLNYADLYVHPAEIELEGIACLEACVCGLVPVVSDSKRAATKNFALTENNKFKCNDADDLAKRIDYWIEHPQERAACQEQYIKYSAVFDQDECMDKMEKMMFDVINKTKDKGSV